MSTVYYTASSLDGFIVDDAGSLDWLLTRDIDSDSGFGAYNPFIAQVGALAMGASTYRWIRNHHADWSYTQPTWVLTHHPEIIHDVPGVHAYSGDVATLHRQLVDAADGADVWIVGGGEVAAQFVAEDLIDDIWIHYAPCTLGAGAPVLPITSEWRVVNTGRNRDFVGVHLTRLADEVTIHTAEVENEPITNVTAR